MSRAAITMARGMSGQIVCECGAMLVEEVGDRGVKPVGGDEWIPFRRTTDYVMCPECFRVYDVRSLITRTRNEDIIEHLERMAEEAVQDRDEPEGEGLPGARGPGAGD